MTSKVEKQWTYNCNGIDIECYVRAIDMGWRCGYVKVPEGNRFFKKEYTELNEIEIHGGLTYSSYELPGVKDSGWYIGFDCSHSGDLKDESIMCEEVKFFNLDCINILTRKPFRLDNTLNDKPSFNMTLWTLDRTIREVEALARQVALEKGDDEC